MDITRRAAIAGAAAATAALAQSDSAELETAEQAWVSAIKSNDAAALKRILAEELVYTHATAIVDTKASYIQSITSGNQKYEGVEYSNKKMRTYGNTGVVTAQLRMTGKTKGVPFDNRVYLTHVWVKQGGGWQLVAHQTTRIP